MSEAAPKPEVVEVESTDVAVLMNRNSRTHIVFKTGRLYMHAVALDGHVRLVQLPLIERRHLKPVLYKGQPYPLKRAVRKLLAAGKTLGITDGARSALKTLQETAA